MSLGHAVHGMYVIFLLFILVEEGAAPGIPASICKWNKCLDPNAPSHLHAVALSPPTYAENLANYLEREAAWSIVRRLVETIGLLDQQFLIYLQVIEHVEEDDHMCSASVHMCGEVWSNLRSLRFLFTVM